MGCKSGKHKRDSRPAAASGPSRTAEVNVVLGTERPAASRAAGPTAGTYAQDVDPRPRPAAAQLQAPAQNAQLVPTGDAYGAAPRPQPSSAVGSSLPKRYDLFISHKQSSATHLARAVKTMAEKLALERGIKISIFLDRDDLNDIQDLSANIRASGAVLLFLTNDVFKSKFVLQELNAAVSAGVNVVPLWDREPPNGIPQFPSPATVELPSPAELAGVGLDVPSARALLERVLKIKADTYQPDGEAHVICIANVLARCGIDVRSATGPIAQYARSWLESETLAKDLELYVPPKATTDPARTNVVDLFEHASQFLRRFSPASASAAGEQLQGPRVLLLLGDPGSSKSTFLSFLHREACRQLAVQRSAPVPVTCLVRLPNVGRDNARCGLRKYVADELGVKPSELPALHKERGLVLLLDAYDELNEAANLWVTNEIGDWASAAIVTCRSSHTALLTNYRECFASASGLVELCTHTFGRDQVLDYLQQYVRLHGRSDGSPWGADEYMRCIESTPGASKLVQNPFTLSMVARVLPQIASDRRTKATAPRKGNPSKNSKTDLDLVSVLELYVYFVKDWFERQWKKLLLSRGSSPWPKAAERWELRNFQSYAEDFCRELAENMYSAAISSVTCQLAKSNEEMGVRRPRPPAGALPAAAAGPTPVPASEARCVELLMTEEPLDKLARDSSPLRFAPANDVHKSVHVRFLHKTLLEYFVADGDFAKFDAMTSSQPDPVARTRSDANALQTESTLHARLLVGEPSILRFHADRSRADADYRSHLLRLLSKSRRKDAVEADITAAANAITILNYAGYSFACSYLRGIRVAGADLQRLEASGADLRGADLSGCALDGVNLRGANLRGARLDACKVTLRPALRWLEEGFSSLAISRDGLHIVSGSRDGTVRMWDVETGSELRRLEGHLDKVTSVAVSPDGRRIFLGSEDKTVRVWDAETGSELRRMEGHAGPVNSVAVFPDGRLIISSRGGFVSCSDDKTVRVWDAETGSELRRLEGHSDKVISVAVSPDGRHIVSGSFDGTVRVWDVETGSELRRMEGRSGQVFSVAVSPDGRRIVAGCWDKMVRVWDTETGLEMRRLEGHSKYVASVAVSPDGRRIVSCSSDKTVRVWDVETGSELRRLEGHSGLVHEVAVSPDGRHIVSKCSDKMVRVWDAETGSELRRLEGHSDKVNSVAMSPDGRCIVSGSEDKTVRVWDAEKGSELQRLEGHSGQVISVALSPDGRRIVSGSSDKTVRVWDLETGSELRCLKGHLGWVTSVALSPDRRHIVSCSGGSVFGNGDKMILVWDAETGVELRRLEGHSDPVTSVTMSPDGRRIVSGSRDNTVRVWDAETGSELRRLEGHTSWVNMVAVSPDGRRIVSGSSDKTVRVWDAETGSELRRLEGHLGWVTSVAVSPDGRCIVSGSGDGTVRVWDAETGFELQRLEGHSDRVCSIAVSQDGRRIVSGSSDKTVRVWDEHKVSEATAIFCTLRIFQTASGAPPELAGAIYDGTTSLGGRLPTLFEELGARFEEGAGGGEEPLDEDCPVELFD
eukprot:tig00020801_g13965.t1